MVTTARNNFENNKNIFSLYIKKPIFKAPHLIYSENVEEADINNIDGVVNKK